MRVPFFTSFCVIALAISLSGCTESAPSASLAANQDVIRRGNIEEPQTLDPALAVDVHAFNILIDLYEGLISEDAQGNLVPGVAASWSVSDDGLSYVFELRSDARWSNGDPVTAQHFVRGFQRASAPATNSSFAFLLDSIENFAQVRSGDLPADDLGVVAVNENTLAIRLRNPNAYFLSLLAMPIAFPLYGDGLDSGQFEEPTKFVGNGPYLLIRRQPGQAVTLQRNKYYWHADSVKTDSIEYVSIVDEEAEFNMYGTGQLDITATIPPNRIDQVREHFGDEARIAPSLALYYLAFDLTEPPLDNPVLRQALSMAIDRELLVSLLGRGEQSAYAVVPPGVGRYHNAGYRWQSDAQEKRHEQARDLYAAAGYSAEEPLNLKFVYDSGGIHEKVALIVTSMWQESLGVTVELDKREWKYLLDTRDNRDEWQVMRFSWFGDYPDASTFLNIFVSDSDQNLSQYNNTEYDQLMRTAARSTSGEYRTNLLAQAEEILINDYPIAPLYFFVSKHMVKPNISGFEENILDRHPSKYLYRKN